MLIALRRFIHFLILVLLLSACHRGAKNLSKLFSPVNLNTFRVTIDNTKDTVIRTPGGCLLDIPSNTFAGGSSRNCYPGDPGGAENI